MRRQKRGKQPANNTEVLKLKNVVEHLRAKKRKIENYNDAATQYEHNKEHYTNAKRKYTIDQESEVNEQTQEDTSKTLQTHVSEIEKNAKKKSKMKQRNNMTSKGSVDTEQECSLRRTAKHCKQTKNNVDQESDACDRASMFNKDEREQYELETNDIQVLYNKGNRTETLIDRGQEAQEDNSKILRTQVSENEKKAKKKSKKKHNKHMTSKDSVDTEQESPLENDYRKTAKQCTNEQTKNTVNQETDECDKALTFDKDKLEQYELETNDIQMLYNKGDGTETTIDNGQETQEDNSKILWTLVSETKKKAKKKLTKNQTKQMTIKDSVDTELERQLENDYRRTAKQCTNEQTENIVDQETDECDKASMFDKDKIKQYELETKDSRVSSNNSKCKRNLMKIDESHATHVDTSKSMNTKVSENEKRAKKKSKKKQRKQMTSKDSVDTEQECQLENDYRRTAKQCTNEQTEHTVDQESDECDRASMFDKDERKQYELETNDIQVLYNNGNGTKTLIDNGQETQEDTSKTMQTQASENEKKAKKKSKKKHKKHMTSKDSVDTKQECQLKNDYRRTAKQTENTVDQESDECDRASMFDKNEREQYELETNDIQVLYNNGNGTKTLIDNGQETQEDTSKTMQTQACEIVKKAKKKSKKKHKKHMTRKDSVDTEQVCQLENDYRRTAKQCTNEQTENTVGQESDECDRASMFDKDEREHYELETNDIQVLYNNGNGTKTLIDNGQATQEDTSKTMQTQASEIAKKAKKKSKKKHKKHMTSKDSVDTLMTPSDITNRKLNN